MTVVVGLLFLATLAALHHIHSRRHRRADRDRTKAEQATADRHADALERERDRANYWHARWLTQCQTTGEWKAVAAAQFTRVIELRTEQAPATQPATLTLVAGGRDERGRFAKAEKVAGHG